MKRHRASAALALAARTVLLALSPLSSSEPAGNAEDELFSELFSESPPSEAATDPLRIVGIDVECPPSFTEAYILSFAREIKRGAVMTRGELDDALKRTAERLDLSGMFYQASASYRTLGKNADGISEARVVIKTSEGFWWGFNFSPWDISLAYSNLFREGKQMMLIAGLNSQGLYYADPAINNGRFSYSIGASHSMTISDGGIDPTYLGQIVRIRGEAGYNPVDDAFFRINAGYTLSRTLPGYFLYPHYLPPSGAELAPLGITASFSPLGSIGGTAGFGCYSYKKKGGTRARAVIGVAGLFPSEPDPQPALIASFSGDLRLSAPRFLELVLHQDAEFFPSPLSNSGIPEFLWARSRKYRGPVSIYSGEIASLSRLSISFDSGARANFGFTRMSLVPELYYEAASARRESYSTDFAFAQDFGALLKVAFSAPVGRTFAFGISAGIPFTEENPCRFVFEVE